MHKIRLFSIKSAIFCLYKMINSPKKTSERKSNQFRDRDKDNRNRYYKLNRITKHLQFNQIKYYN